MCSMNAASFGDPGISGFDRICGRIKSGAVDADVTDDADGEGRYALWFAAILSTD